MREPVIRKWEPEDDPEMRKMFRATYVPIIEAASAEFRPRGWAIIDYIIAERMSGTYDFLATRTDGQAWVADLLGEPVGGLVSFRREDGYYIDNLFVHPDHQRAGNGQMLMDEVERWAIGRGYSAAVLQSNHILRDAHRFYLNRNYVLVGTHPLEGQPDMTMLDFAKSLPAAES